MTDANDVKAAEALINFLRTPLSFAPIPDATGIWYNAIENVNYSHQYSVYIKYNDRSSGGCSYFGNGTATNCP